VSFGRGKAPTLNRLPPEPPNTILQEYLIDAEPSNAYRYFGVCPQARCMEVYSLTHAARVIFILPCNCWGCRYCAERKIKALAAKVMLAAPNRLLTLTIDPALHEDPKSAWLNTRRQVSILIRQLRLKHGPIEYLRVTEVTKKGWPHYHLLVRSGYLPHSVVRDTWATLTGAKIVDLRQVTKTFSAYTYLVKYLSKLHSLGWTERHVSMSRAFTPPRPVKHKMEIEYAEPKFSHQHPAQFVLEWYPGYTAKRLSQHAHLLLHPGQVSPPIGDLPPDDTQLLDNPL